MDSETRKLLDEVYKRYESNPELPAPELKTPQPVNIDSEAPEIYKQARRHRKKLIKYYIDYTACAAIVIAWLVLAQAIVRIMTPDKNFQIMPEWTMNLLVLGLFGQFVGLLKIVTKSVWNFKPFLDHHTEMLLSQKNDSEKLS